MALRIKIIADDKVSTTLLGIGKSIGRLGIKFAKFGVLGAAAIGGIGVKLAADLEKGLREIGTLMGGLTDVQMKNMSHELQGVAASSGQAMKSLTKARYDIVSAGFVEAADSMMLLNTSASLAVGGVTEVATAADLLTTTLNAYNLTSDDAVDISDKLFTIVRLGKTTMNELGGSMGRVLAIAGQAGVSLDEVGAAMASLTASGQSTEEATTAIRSAIVELLKPSEDLQSVIEELGYTTGTSLIESEGFAEALLKIRDHAEANNIPMTDLFGNIRSMQAVLPLTGTAMEGFVENLRAMDESTGATALAVEEMQKSFSIQLSMLKANVSNIMTEIGNAIIDIIHPKIVEANEKLSTLGEIGWDNIAKVLTENWKLVLTKLGEVAWIGAQIIGLKFKDGIKSVITPEWWETIFGTSQDSLELWGKVTEKLMTDLGLSWKEAGKRATEMIEENEEGMRRYVGMLGDTQVKIDELIAKLKQLGTDGYDWLTTKSGEYAETSAENVDDSADKQVNAIEKKILPVFSLMNYTLRKSSGEYAKFINKVNASTIKGKDITLDFAHVISDTLTDAFDVATTGGDVIRGFLDKLVGMFQQAILAAAGVNKALKAMWNPLWGGAAIVAALIALTAIRAVIRGIKFEHGGVVPEVQGFQFGGVNSKDTVPAILSPREIVSTPAASDIYGNEITRFNQMAESGYVGGGIGRTINLNIQALDAESFIDYARREPEAFAEAINIIEERRFR